MCLGNSWNEKLKDTEFPPVRHPFGLEWFLQITILPNKAAQCKALAVLQVL